MKRFPCLVLDANIIIFLFQQGLWGTVVERCEIIVSETVVDEADFYADAEGAPHAIDLQPDIAAGRIQVVAIAATEVASFRARFDPLYVQKLDDGETESLAFCLREGDPCRLCSSDGIVFRVLSVVDRSDQGVSLEEVLQEIGLARPLSAQFTKGFRDSHRKRGFEDKLAGMGLKKGSRGR